MPYLSPFLSDHAGTANADLYTDKDIKDEIKRLHVVIYKRQRERTHLKAWRATHGPEYDFSNAPALNGLR